MRADSRAAWLSATVSVLMSILALKVWLALQYKFLVWDSYVYLLNARVFIFGQTAGSYFEVLRPPLLPFVVSLLWRITGESVAVASVVQPAFTVATGGLVYFWVRNMSGSGQAIFTALFLLLSPIPFFWTNQILTHGVGLFFSTLGAYSFWRAVNGSHRYYALGLASISVAGLARYPDALVLLAALGLMAVELARRRKTGRKVLVSGEVRWVLLGVVAATMIWSPWLVWNYAFAGGNPLASLVLGAGIGAQVGPQGPLYYYAMALPSVAAVPGAVLLFLGFADRRRWRESGFILVALWFLVAFAFYSFIPNKQPRFFVDFFVPLSMLVGVGLGNLYSILEGSRAAKRTTAVLLVSWLAISAYSGVQMSLGDASFNQTFFASRGFSQAVVWVDGHSNATDIGASDYAPQFSYYAHRDFLSAASLVETAAKQNVSLYQLMAADGVRLVIVTDFFANANGFGAMPYLKLAAVVGGFRIYSVSQ